MFCRKGETGEESNTDTTVHQVHNTDQSPQENNEAPGESDSSPPDVLETKKDEGKERDEDKLKPQLSSSVTIDMADVHSSLELSTIAGASGMFWVVAFSHDDQEFALVGLQSQSQMDVSILVPWLGFIPPQSYI